MTETTDPAPTTEGLPNPSARLFTIGADGVQEHDTLDDSGHGRSYPVVQVEHGDGLHFFCIPAGEVGAYGSAWSYSFHGSGVLSVLANGKPVIAYAPSVWKIVRPFDTSAVRAE